MTERKRADRARRRKHIEFAGYRIDPPLQIGGLWSLRQPTGRIIQHYKYEASAITGAEKDIQRAILRHETHGDLNDRWQEYVKRYLEYQQVGIELPAVDTNEIADNAVINTKIVQGSITESELANNAVTIDKILKSM